MSEIIIFRPSVEHAGSPVMERLEKAFETMTLLDKTACEDRIVYVFTKRDPDVGRTSEPVRRKVV